MVLIDNLIARKTTQSLLKSSFWTILSRNCFVLAKKEEQCAYKRCLKVKSNPICNVSKVYLSAAHSVCGKKHSHHMTWMFEKFGSLGLLVLIPAAIMYPSSTIDYIVSPLIAYHHYVGIEQVLTDYARPSVVGPMLAKVFEILNIITTLIALIGFILFSKNQMCLGEAAQLIWSVKPKEKSS